MYPGVPHMRYTYLNLLDSPELLQILVILSAVIKPLLPNVLGRAIVILNFVRRLRILSQTQFLGRKYNVSLKIVREKSRECHNYKPQPFPDTKRKRKQTKPNKRKSNKRTKGTKISFLFPKRGNCNAKRTEKHKNKITQRRRKTNRLVEWTKNNKD